LVYRLMIDFLGLGIYAQIEVLITISIKRWC